MHLIIMIKTIANGCDWLPCGSGHVTTDTCKARHALKIFYCCNTLTFIALLVWAIAINLLCNGFNDGYLPYSLPTSI